MQTNQPTLNIESSELIKKYINGSMTSIMLNNEYQYIYLKNLNKEVFYKVNATKNFRLYVNEFLKRATANRMESIKYFPDAHKAIKEIFTDEVTLQTNSQMSMFLHLTQENKDKVEAFTSNLLENQ